MTKSGPSQNVDRVTPAIEPRIFLQQYVARRKPCIFTAHSSDIKIGALSFNDLLSDEMIADTIVKVEHKCAESNRFGTGLERCTMSLRKLLNAIKQGEDSLYLTTQYEDETDGQSDAEAYLKNLYPEPIPSLLKYLPDRPSLFPTLIPHQINAWLGFSSEGSSSGLHHDFHDNLYILCRGRKRFILFPPQDAPRLQMTGSIQTIFENGLISYVDNIRSDGAPEKCMVENVSDTESQIFNGSSDIESDFDFDGEDDYVDSDHGSEETPKDPPSFSQVPVPVLHDFVFKKKIHKKYKSLAETRPIVVDLKAGEMLYLPASWMHEVSSFNDLSEEKSDQFHFAINYWFHPPSKGAGYVDDYWEKLYEAALALCHSKTNERPLKRKKK